MGGRRGGEFGCRGAGEGEGGGLLRIGAGLGWGQGNGPWLMGGGCGV